MRWGRRSHNHRVFLAGTALLLAAIGTQPQSVAAARGRKVQQTVGALAPAFVPNTGQIDPAARFLAVGGGRAIYFTAHDVRLLDARERRSLWLTFVDSVTRDVAGESPTGGRVTFLNRAVRSDDTPTATTLAAYRDIVYRGLWPGIDARIAGVEGGLKYAFEIAPDGDPRAIHLRYRGADHVAVNGEGELVIEAGGSTIVDRAPTAYQRVDGRTAAVDVRFDVRGADVTFSVGRYDRTAPLVIDPTLAYSTYLGSSGYDAGRAIAVDLAGAAYVVGTTRASDFPTTPGADQTTFRGGTGNTPSDAFVAKINPEGTHFDYVTYLGGSGNDEAFGVAVDAAGNAYITGYTESEDFPATIGAFQESIGLSHHDGFLVKLDAAGTALVYSTFLGSNGSTDPASIAVDGIGNAYVTGRTFAGNVPVTPGAQAWSRNGQGDSFLLKFDAAGAHVTYGTYIGGPGTDVATSVAADASGHAFVTGWTRSIDGIAGNTTPGSSGQVPQPNPNGPSFKSTDGGQTFTSVNTSVHTASSLAFAIDPSQPATVYQGTREQGLLKSTDGGAHWTQPSGALGPGTAAFSVAVSPAGVILASGAGNNVMFRSVDAGATWSPVVANTLDATFAPSHPSTVYARNNGVLKSTDAGATWTQVYPVTNASTSGIAIDPGNDNVVYVGTGNAELLKTTDGGVTWAHLPIDVTAVFKSVISVAVDPTLTSVVWAGFATGDVYRSLDAGVSWTLMPAASVKYPGRMVFDGGTLYISDGGDFVTRTVGTGSIAKTADRGASWSHVLIRGNPVPTLGLAVLNGLVYAGGDMFTDAFVWKIDTNATTNSIMFGTYLGGALDDAGVAVAVDPSGNAVVAVETHSADFPTTLAGPVTNSGLARFSTDGTSLTASSYVGASNLQPALARALAVGGDYSAYVAGVFGTSDQGVWVDRIDRSGVTGASFTLNGRQSNVGAPSDVPAGVAIGPMGWDVFIAGSTQSVDFPTTGNAAQPLYGSGASDAFIAKVSFGTSTPPPANLALNKPVAVSSAFSSQFAGANAVDGDPSTRWSSEFSDPQWISVDLLQPYAISEVVLRWETAYGTDYLVEVSDDAATWRTIRTVTSGDGGVDDLTGLSGTGRYLRITGTRRGTEWGYSLWELEVYGTPAATADLALHRPVVASSVAFASSAYAAANAVDGDPSTRWSSEFSDDQWIYVDLADTYTVYEVILRWETAFGADYQVQMSDDASTWRTIRDVTGGDGGVDDLTGLSGAGRYVRILGTRRGTQWGYSLWSLEVHGDPAPRVPDLALHRPVVSSSDLSSSFAAANAVDGDQSTRWSSDFSDPQWIYVDLGSWQLLREVRLSWETAYAADFDIQVSDDAATWTTIESVTNNTGGVNDFPISAGGRYVRVLGTRRGTEWGYSLWSFEVFGFVGAIDAGG